MTPHGFTEDQLVERPALEVFEALGWEVVSAAEEVFGPGGTLGRSMKDCPRAYTPELYKEKVGVLFEHVYESYQGEGKSVYNRVA